MHWPAGIREFASGIIACAMHINCEQIFCSVDFIDRIPIKKK